MATSGADSGSFLGAGARQPTCWQFFGFDGPTNRYNLDIAWRERLPTSLAYNPNYAAEQYRKCIAELDA